MDRSLIDYIPLVLWSLSKQTEIKALLEAEQPEVEALDRSQRWVLNNQFILTATEYGIKRWERMLHIIPKGTDSLEMRRARVLTLLNLQLPYTKKWLQNWLDALCGEGNYDLTVAAYTIALDLGYDKIPEAEKLMTDITSTLMAVRPANMLLEINGMRQTTGTISVAGYTDSAAQVDVYPARAAYDAYGAMRIGGFTDYAESIDVYPIT